MRSISTRYYQNSFRYRRLVEYLRAKCKRALSKSGLPDLDYALNPYLGCEHACIYCYGRNYVPPAVAKRWGEIVIVRDDVCDALKREIKLLRKGVVGIGTISDAYQPIEEREYLTRRCIEILLEHSFRVSIQTKSSLIERDLDLLKNSLVDVGITITFIDDSKARRYEPRASPPSERIEVARYLRKKGVELWIFYGPVIPGVNDDDDTLKELILLAKELDSVLYIDPLHPKKFMFDEGILVDEARRVKSREFRKRIEHMFRVCEEMGVKCKPGFEGDAVDLRKHLSLDAFLT